MLKNKKLIRFVMKFSVFSTLGVALIFFGSKLQQMNFFSHPINDSDASNNKPLFYRSKFFFDTKYSPVYEIFSIVEAFFGFFVGTIFVYYNTLVILTELHLCDQLQILKLQIESLILQIDGQSFDYKIKAIVQWHIQLKW